MSTVKDTIVESLYQAFQQNPNRLKNSYSQLTKQFGATEQEVRLAKELYRLNPKDFLVAQALNIDLVYDSIPASELFEALTGQALLKQKFSEAGANRSKERNTKKLEKKIFENHFLGKPSVVHIQSDDEWEVKQKWVKGKEGSQLLVKKEPVQDFSLLKEQILNDVRKYAPKYKTFKRQYKDGHLLVLSLGDIHLGKLSVKSETGEDYNVEIAYNRVIEGVKGLLQKASGFNIDTVLLIIGNDILHTDTKDRTTTDKTPQDTDGMWHENFIKAKNLYVEIIEMLMPLGNIYVQFNGSNHDRMSGFFLAQTVEAWFRNADINFDVSMKPRKYFQYGTNLIGTTHGESKESDLPLLMAVECPEEWGTSGKRYWYCHHIHHKKSKEYVGVCVEYLRSPSAADAWHNQKGFLSEKSLEAFIHDLNEGQICRLTQYV